MPNKMAVILFVSALLLVGLLGCGGDGTGSVPRVSPLGIVTGNTESGGVTGGGGGGGAAGACETTWATCYNVDSATCSSIGGTLAAGTTCQNLGYVNCTTVSGIEYCN